MPTKTDINPNTGKMYAVNPATGQWDDNYWANVVEPQLKGTSFDGSSGGGTSADELLSPVQKQLKEQIVFLKDFIDKNPLGFDMALARQMSEEQFKPYYNEVLSDFVEPLQKKIERSTADETRLLSELVRQEDLGSKQTKQQTADTIAKAREGMAGAGLLNSGIERGVSAKNTITGKQTLEDFIARSKALQTDTSLTEQRTREDAQTSIAQQQRDIFGRGRQYEQTMAKDVESQRGTALKQRGLRAIEAIGSRYGAPMAEIPSFLQIYNQ